LIYTRQKAKKTVFAREKSAVMSTGAARTKTTVLLTPEEIDQAVKRPVDYEPPPIATGD
jgi:hypothetical protein